MTKQELDPRIKKRILEGYEYRVSEKGMDHKTAVKGVLALLMSEDDIVLARALLESLSNE